MFGFIERVREMEGEDKRNEKVKMKVTGPAPRVREATD